MGKNSGPEEEQDTYCISQGDYFGDFSQYYLQTTAHKSSAPMGAGNAGEAPAGLGPSLAQEDGLISEPVLSVPNPI